MVDGCWVKDVGCRVLVDFTRFGKKITLPKHKTLTEQTKQNIFLI
jgi:hypothetical protein